MGFGGADVWAVFGGTGFLGVGGARGGGGEFGAEGFAEGLDFLEEFFLADEIDDFDVFVLELGDLEVGGVEGFFEGVGEGELEDCEVLGRGLIEVEELLESFLVEFEFLESVDIFTHFLTEIIMS